MVLEKEKDVLASYGLKRKHESDLITSFKHVPLRYVIDEHSKLLLTKPYFTVFQLQTSQH